MPRPGLRSHDHAGAAAVGLVVDGAMTVVGEISEVVYVHVEQALLARLAN